jgi:septal ring factor EnvC (AmiA/AmiB activator)
MDMSKNKVQLVWFPFSRTGKVRVFSIHALLLRLVIILIFLCIAAIPFLQSNLSSLKTRIKSLESMNASLQDQVKALEYVKQNLNQIEEKDRVLRDYFGMQEFQSLDQIIGRGGANRKQLSGLEPQEIRETPWAAAAPEATGIQGLQNKMELLLKRLTNNYDIFHLLVKKQDEIWEETPSIMPLNTDHFQVTSLFGWRSNPFTNLREFHTGLDVVASEGVKVIAPAKATVVSRSYDSWLGNYLVLDHGKGMKTIYGHLAQILVPIGQKVKKGDPLAVMGNTGLSTSRHLHYMIILNDRITDPRQYILNLQG